jgi:hypothetical protein
MLYIAVWPHFGGTSEIDAVKATSGTVGEALRFAEARP